MIEGFKELNLIIDEEFADGFGKELLIDNFETDFAELLVASLVDSGGEARADFLKFRKLVNDSFR